MPGVRRSGAAESGGATTAAVVRAISLLYRFHLLRLEMKLNSRAQVGFVAAVKNPARGKGVEAAAEVGGEGVSGGEAEGQVLDRHPVDAGLDPPLGVEQPVVAAKLGDVKRVLAALEGGERRPPADELVADLGIDVGEQLVVAVDPQVLDRLPGDRRNREAEYDGERGIELVAVAEAGQRHVGQQRAMAVIIDPDTQGVAFAEFFGDDKIGASIPSRPAAERAVAGIAQAERQAG